MQLSLVRKWGERAELLHRGGRRRPDHLFVHRRDAGGVPRSGHSRRPQDHPEAVVPRAARRPRAWPTELIHRVTQAAGRRNTCRARKTGDVIRLTGGEPTRRRTCTILSAAMEHLRARQDGDVPGGVLLHAAAADQRAPQERHPVPQPVPQEQRLLEPDPDRQARIERRTASSPCWWRTRSSATATARGRTATSRCGPSASSPRASCDTARRQRLAADSAERQASYGTPRGDLRDRRARVADGGVRRRVPRVCSTGGGRASPPRSTARAQFPAEIAARHGAARAAGDAAGGRRDHPLRQGRPGRRGVICSRISARRATRSTPRRRAARLGDPAVLCGRDPGDGRRLYICQRARAAWRSSI